MFIKLNNYYIRRDKIETFHYYINPANGKFWLEVWVAGDELVITYPDSESLSIDIEKLKEALNIDRKNREPLVQPRSVTTRTFLIILDKFNRPDLEKFFRHYYIWRGVSLRIKDL